MSLPISPDDQDLATAVQASLEDSPERGQSQSYEGTSTNAEPDPNDVPSRYTIEDCIRDFSTNQALQNPSIYDVDGDTFVFIDPPPRQPEQSLQSYEQYKCRYSDPFLMQREKLSKTSPVLKEKLDSPNYQFRTLRRRGLAAKGKLPENVHYVLDLTPATEGEEAVYLTASLSCPEGVRYWHEAGKIWKISDRLVGGKEEYSPAQRTLSLPTTASTLEYSPLRHISAIERVLAVIQGLDVTFDSAVKIWTTAVVAQSLGITNDSCTYLTDSLITWIRAEPNHYFLEINTEISFRIANCLQNQDLARDAFALLVGEEGLDSLCRIRTHKKNKNVSAFGRKKDELPEALLERVEYASKSFIERNIAEFQDLVGNEMRWLEDLTRVKRLAALNEPPIQGIISLFKRTLKAFVRSQMLNIICDDCPEVEGHNLRGGKSGILLPCKNASQVYNSDLLPTERLFTRTFWTSLKDTRCFHHIPIDKKPGSRSDDLRFKGWPDRDPVICRFMMAQNLEGRISKLEELAAEGQSLLNQVRYTNMRKETDVSRFSWDENLNVIRQTRGSETIPDSTQHGLCPALSSPDSSYDAMERFHTIIDSINHIFESPKPNTHPLNIPIRPKYPAADGLSNLPKETAPKHDSLDAPMDLTSHRPLVLKPAKPADELNDDFNGDSHDTQDARWSPHQLFKHDFGFTESSSNDSRTASSDYHFAAHDNFPPSSQPFNVQDLLNDIGDYLKNFAREKLAAADSNIRQDPYQPAIMNTLTSLKDVDWKYLPLWAGGLDDDTGAVFADDIMETEPDGHHCRGAPS